MHCLFETDLTSVRRAAAEVHSVIIKRRSVVSRAGAGGHRTSPGGRSVLRRTSVLRRLAVLGLTLVVLTGALVPHPSAMSTSIAELIPAGDLSDPEGPPEGNHGPADSGGSAADGDESPNTCRLLPMAGLRSTAGEPVQRARRVHDGGPFDKASTGLSASAAHPSSGRPGQLLRSQPPRKAAGLTLFALGMCLRL